MSLSGFSIRTVLGCQWPYDKVNIINVVDRRNSTTSARIYHLDLTLNLFFFFFFWSYEYIWFISILPKQQFHSYMGASAQVEFIARYMSPPTPHSQLPCHNKNHQRIRSCHTLIVLGVSAFSQAQLPTSSTHHTWLTQPMTLRKGLKNLIYFPLSS